MLSYIFMKILEKRPARYDAGIKLLSAGHADRIRKRIVHDHVKPGMNVLDIGCGTGTLIVDAAKAGARATGVDISTGMLDVARQRIAGCKLGEDRIMLYNAGVVEIGSLFKKGSFDLIVSTLVFSELYAEERLLALRQIKELLKPGGALVIAVEVRPGNLPKRMIHALFRFPLSVLTYIIAQTGTRPVTGISRDITESGLCITGEDRSFLESFAVISARNVNSGASRMPELPPTKRPDEDFSPMRSLWDFAGRWFPNPVEPGLRTVGKPGRDAPVILTGNYHLTVRRVERSLKGEDAFLLVAPSNGINVWCASCGGDLNTHSVITVIKTSRINERVNHGRIVMPQFSAPGIDRNLLKKETGRTGVFGPAYARDIPLYLRDRKTVFDHNRAEFSLPFRLEMLLSMNFLLWMVVGMAALLMDPDIFFPVTVFYWTTGLLLYGCFPFIPGKSGWLKAAALSLIEVVAIAIYSILVLKKGMFEHWGAMITVSVITLWFGFDLRGIVAGEPSEAERLMERLGLGSLGHLFSGGVFSPGRVRQDTARCSNCRICLMVCPKGVYGLVNGSQVRIRRRDECFACRACVVQCGEEALSLG